MRDGATLRAWSGGLALAVPSSPEYHEGPVSGSGWRHDEPGGLKEKARTPGHAARLEDSHAEFGHAATEDGSRIGLGLR